MIKIYKKPIMTAIIGTHLVRVKYKWFVEIKLW